MPSAAAERAETLGPPALHGHRGAGGSAQPGSISSTQRCQLAARSQTTEQSTLPIGPSRRARTIVATSRQQLDRVGPGQRRVGVGEALADVAEAGRTEQRLGDGVGDRVAVAVAVEPGQAGEHAAAEHQRPGRVVAKAMDVEALTDASSRPSTFTPSSWAAPHPLSPCGDLAVARPAGPRTLTPSSVGCAPTPHRRAAT